MDIRDIEVSADMIHTFHAEGAVTIPNFVCGFAPPCVAGAPRPSPHSPSFSTPAELASVQATFDSLMKGAYPIPGNDLGEHTPGLLNCTAFTLYHTLEALGGALAEVDRRALRVTERLYGEGAGVFARDYEQLLRKLADRPKSCFPPHWDQMYWPRSRTESYDLRTATFSLAVNAADAENGCLWCLPGSHKLRGGYAGRVSTLEGSRPLGGGVIDVALLPEDVPRRKFLALAAGDATFHEEWVLHGSEANVAKDRTRDTLIFAYRAKSMIEIERGLGFRHSYNDAEEVLRKVRGPPL